MILRIKVCIAKWICGVIPFKCINNKWYRLPFGVSRAFWPWKKHSVEPYELDAIRKFGRNAGVYLDIGANVGLLTLAMREWAGNSARIFAVEPNPQAYELLGKVMRLNRIRPEGLWSLAIADHCGTTKFHVSKKDALGVMSSLQGNDPDGYELYVPCMTIDALSEGWDRLDYIKIDVEGAEVLVVKGAQATLRKLQPVVQVEVHGPFLGAFGHNVEQLFNLMNSCGYEALNAVTLKVTTATEFVADTGLDARHPITGDNMRHMGYGHVVFRPCTKNPEVCHA